jgi:hypothetical protein
MGKLHTLSADEHHLGGGGSDFEDIYNFYLI